MELWLRSKRLRRLNVILCIIQGDPLWMLRYNQLREFYQATHHANVPTKYAQNRGMYGAASRILHVVSFRPFSSYSRHLLALGRWVSTQRLQYRLYLQGQPSSMTRERIRMLEELSFVWDAAPDRDGSPDDEHYGDGSSE